MSLKKDTKGFTIIEVLIVLAIAGLILLIIFLAVPALQRNSRNTQTRNDVAMVLGAVNDYKTYNSGKLPVDAFADTDGNVCMASASISACGATDANKVGQVRAGTTVDVSTTAPTALGVINIATNYGCNGTGLTATAKTGAVAAQFRVETAGSATGTPQCQES